MRAAAHIQRAVAVAGDHTHAGLLIQCAIHARQQATDGGGGARRFAAAVGFAPGAKGLEPQVAFAAHRHMAQALAHGVAQLQAVVDQHCAHGGVDLTGQLLQALLGGGDRLRLQQAFIHRVATAQLLGGRRYVALVAGGGDAGKACVVAPHVQLHGVGGVVEGASEEQIVGQHLPELALDTACRFQDRVLPANQALHLALAKQGWAVFQRQRDRAAAQNGLATRDNTVAAGGRQFHRIGGARAEVHIPRHLQGAHGIARRHAAAAVHRQCGDTPGTTQGSAVVHRHRRGQRTIHRQQAPVDGGCAAIGAVAVERQATGAGFDQAALVHTVGGSLVAGAADGVVGLVLLAGIGAHAVLPALVDQGLLPGGMLGTVFGLALEQGLVRDAIAPHIALPGCQTHVHRPEQLPRSLHRPAQVRYTPADNGVRRLGERAIELRGGGQQHLQRLLVGHIGIAFHHQCQRAGGMGR